MTAKKSSAKPRAATARRTRAERVDPDLLTLWTARFALFISSGVTLLATLSMLEQETVDATLCAVTRDLREKVDGGEILSQAMARHASIFSPTYLAMIRAGEVGGVLDVALNRLTELLVAGVAQRTGRRRLDRQALVDWLWTLGTLLKSGVPILIALETVAGSAPKGLREVTLVIRQAVREGGRISDSMEAHAGLFEPTTAIAVGVGEVEGRLDQALLDLARWYEQHLLPLERAGKLPPLKVKSVKPVPAPKEGAMETNEIIRRANQLLQEAIDLGVERIELRPADDDQGTAVLFSGRRRLQSVSLDYFASIVRRFKVMSDISPYGVRQGRGRIHIRYKEKEYYASVQVEGDGLVLTITPK
jgi:hypothetical protein